MCEDAMSKYVESAWEINQEVPGERSMDSSGQVELVQRISKEAVYVSMGGSDKKGQLAASIRRFDQNHQLLLDGNSVTGMSAIPETTENTHLAAMEEVEHEWTKLKPLVQEVANSGYATSSALDEISDVSAALKVKLDAANLLYSTFTQTTTHIPINILLPLPLTGLWAPGPTMRTAVMVAQDIIIYQQRLLPEYKIISV